VRIEKAQISFLFVHQKILHAQMGQTWLIFFSPTVSPFFLSLVKAKSLLWFVEKLLNCNFVRELSLSACSHREL